MSQEPPKVTVKLTPEDYMALMRFCDRYTPGGRARMRRLYLMGLAAYLVVALVSLRDPEHGLSNPRQLALFLGSSALFIGAGYYLFLAWLRPTMIRASLVRGSRRLLLAPTTMTLEAEQVALENEGGRGHLPWKHLVDVVETDAYLFLVVGKVNAIAVPKRCFDAKADFQAFADFARARLDAEE